MAIELGAAYISILPDTSKIAPGVKSALTGTASEADKAGAVAGKRFGSKMGAGIKALAGPALAVFSAAAVGGFFKDAFAEAEDARKVGAQTAAVLKSTAGAAKISAKGVSDLAGAISAKTGIDDEAIQAGENMILTFKEIRNEAGKGNDIFNQTTKVVTDMSVAMGTDMKNSSILVGKALNDPIKGLSALTRVGVSFTSQQRAQIKALIDGGDANAAVAMGLVADTKVYTDMVKRYGGDGLKAYQEITKGMSKAQKKQFDYYSEGGHQMEAQKRILKELNSEFAGSAEAQATPAMKASVAWGNFKETIGTKLQPVLDALMNFFTTKFLPGVLAVGGAVGSLVGFLGKNHDVVVALVAAVTAAGVAYGVYTGYVKTVSAVTKTWTFVQKLLNHELKANPVGVVITVLALLVGALVLAYKKSDTFRAIVDRAWAAIKRAVGTAWNGTIKPALKAFWGFLKNDLMPVIRTLWASVIKPTFKVIGTLIAATWNGVIKPILKAWWAYMTNVLFPVIRFLLNNVVRPIMSKVGGAIKGAWEKVIRPAFLALKNFVGENGTLHKAFRNGIDAISRVWEGLKNAAKAPVRFVVDTLYNNGIRKMIGLLPGVSTPAAVKLGFATGGYTGRGKKYEPAGVVHRDEFVIRKEARSRFEKENPGALDYLNRWGKLPGFASGGRVWPLPGGSWSTYPGHDGIDLNAPNDLGKPFLAAADGVISYVGWGRGYGDGIFERGPYGELVYGHSMKPLVHAGQMVKAGQPIGLVGSTGHSTGPHLHFGFPGGTPAGALAFLNGASHIAGAKGGGGFFENAKALIDTAKKVASGISGMASSGWAGLLKDSMRGVAGNLKDYVNGKIPGPGPIPGGIFDNGGVLEPGAFAFNASKRPEAIYNHQQFKAFAEGVGNAQRTRRTEFVITNWKTGEGFFREIAQDTYDGEQQFAATTRRMR